MSLADFAKKVAFIKRGKFDIIYCIFGLTIFLSAFLLFLVQPLISKYILPWFGGTAAVWIICLIFFQAVLLIGYLYAHLIAKYLPIKIQLFVHFTLILIAIILLPIIPDAALKPQPSSNPTLQIILILSLSIGLPFLILSATSPLLQNWLSRIKTKKTPYKLYAISNAGSLTALLAFPFVLEPLLPIKALSNLWSIFFIAFTLLCALTAFYLWQNKKANIPLLSDLKNNILNKVPLKIKLSWLAIAACTSTLLLAVTNKICQDIPAVPIFWVIPLALYLLSFIIAFSDSKKNKSIPIIYFLLIFTFLICLYIYLNSYSFLFQIFSYLVLLFIFSLALHNHLYDLKPGTENLTAYYLIISLGGVLGGIFTGIIAPLIFNSYFELTLIIITCSLISLYLFFKNCNLSEFYQLHKKMLSLKNPLIIILIIIMIHFTYITQIYVMSILIKNKAYEKLDVVRDFYGKFEIRAQEDDTSGGQIISLISGSTLHGNQFTIQDKQTMAISYYDFLSGIGLVFNQISFKQLKIGGIGLGTGTIAAYAHQGDYLKFYEINPDVIKLNKNYFTYLANSLAQIDIILGDARISLENEPPQNFDIMVLDAFSSDSIPIHLVTREAFELYLKHLKPDGILAFHISNRYIDLTPIILKLAEYYNLETLFVKSNENGILHITKSEWILLTTNKEVLDNLATFDKKEIKEKYNLAKYKLWTDDYTNVLQVMKWY